MKANLSYIFPDLSKKRWKDAKELINASSLEEAIALWLSSPERGRVVNIAINPAISELHIGAIFEGEKYAACSLNYLVEDVISACKDKFFEVVLADEKLRKSRKMAKSLPAPTWFVRRNKKLGIYIHTDLRYPCVPEESLLPVIAGYALLVHGFVRITRYYPPKKVAEMLAPQKFLTLECMYLGDDLDNNDDNWWVEELKGEMPKIREKVATFGKPKWPVH
ncbi:MAG: hypothetical protein D6780_03465 [Candidatus Dadabacteria bacterium]|nr:MAG: hypothetical protein D6780_03465 [Candidatus Dadabacteria bacterium]